MDVFSFVIGVSVEGFLMTKSGFPRQVQGPSEHLAIGLVSVLWEADIYVFIRGNTCMKRWEGARKGQGSLQMASQVSPGEGERERSGSGSLLVCHTVSDRLTRALGQPLSQVSSWSATWHAVIVCEQLWEVWSLCGKRGRAQSLAMNGSLKNSAPYS